MPKLEISKVHDVYAQPTECPLCALMEGVERTYLLSFQHSRVMEPNVRVKTNAVGFCPEHTGKLYQGENKLGLALVMLTHLEEKANVIAEALDGSVRAARVPRRERSRRIQEIAGSLEGLRDSCFICGLLEQDLTRYAWTILYLWRKDPQFPGQLRASRGFCLSHFCRMLVAACDILRGDSFARWLDDVVPAMKRTLDGLDKELLAFTQLHQAGNRSLGTETERSALSRTLQMLSGRIQKQ